MGKCSNGDAVQEHLSKSITMCERTKAAGNAFAYQILVVNVGCGLSNTNILTNTVALEIGVPINLFFLVFICLTQSRMVIFKLLSKYLNVGKLAE